MMRLMPLLMSIGTCLTGLIMALVLAAGTELAPFGWFLAVLGALGVVTWPLMVQPRGRAPRGGLRGR